MYFGVFFSTFILIFKKEAFDIGISKIGLNVTMLEVGIGLILMALQNDIFAKKTSGTWTFFLRWFGRHSYEIYLTHSFFIIFIARLWFKPGQSSLFILFLYALVIIISGLSGQFISTHFSEPMNKFFNLYPAKSNKVFT